LCGYYNSAKFTQNDNEIWHNYQQKKITTFLWAMLYMVFRQPEDAAYK